MKIYSLDMHLFLKAFSNIEVYKPVEILTEQDISDDAFNLLRKVAFAPKMEQIEDVSLEQLENLMCDLSKYFGKLQLFENPVTDKGNSLKKIKTIKSSRRVL